MARAFGRSQIAVSHSRLQPPAASRESRPAGRGRNSFLDAVRAVALIRIIVWHTYGYVWLSYLIASMPAMFFVAGSLMAQSLERGNVVDVLYRRFKRLLLPFWVFGAFVLLLTSLEAGAFAAPGRAILWWLFPVWDPTATEWGLTLTVPLWYLRCLTWLLLASPLLLWFWRRLGLSMLLVPLAGVAVLEAGGAATRDVPWQFHDLSLYSFFWILGFAYHDGSIGRLTARARATICALAIAGAVAVFFFLEVPGNIVNRSYPLHLFVGLAWLFGALTIEGTIARLASHGKVAAAINWLNQHALTVYLWQTVGLLTMYQLLWTDDQSNLVRTVLALPIVVSVTFVAIQLFGWVENLAARRGSLLSSRLRLPAMSAPKTALQASGAVVGFVGVVAILAAMTTVARDPERLVQATAYTVPPSGAGLHYRAQTAVVVAGPPVRAVSGRTDPVTDAELQAELQAWLNQWNILGVAVSIRRETGESWSGAAGYREPDRPFYVDEPYWIASVTKTFTAAMILRLAEAGSLTLDDPVSLYVPDFPNADRFTIRHLLQHTSGQTSDSEEPYAALAEAAAAGLQFEPGTAYLYSRAGYYLLGLVIEAVTGRSFSEVLQEEIIGPLQLQSTVLDEQIAATPSSTHPYYPGNAFNSQDLWTQSGIFLERSQGQWDYHGVLWSSGGLWSTPSDLTRWALALWDSDLVISPESLRQMTTFLDQNYDYTGLGTYPFCTCWWDHGVLQAERWGFAGTTGILEFDPEDKIALAVHISGRLFDENMIDALEDFSHRIRRLVRGRPFDVATPSAARPLNVHIVESGDTLFDLASRLGIPPQDQARWVADVISMNDIDEQGSLEVGMQLRLPADWLVEP